MSDFGKKFSDGFAINLNSVTKNKIIENNKKLQHVKQKKFTKEVSNNEIDIGENLVKNDVNFDSDLVNENDTNLSTMQIDNNTQNFKNSSKLGEFSMKNSDIEEFLVNNVEIDSTMHNTKNDENNTAISPHKNEQKHDIKKTPLIQFSEFFKNLNLSKLWSNKNSKIAILVVILAVVLVMFLNMSNTTIKTNSTQSKSFNYNSLEYVSSKNYIENLESKLSKVLSSISGAGKVNVMITLESGPELKIATSVDERTNTSTSNSTTTTSVTVIENPIIITQNGQSSPLVLMEIVPVVKGVIVVAEGAHNTKVKLQLLEAVQSLLKVNSSNIQIYSGI